MGALDYHVAQVNIGTPLGPVDSPVMSEFMALLDPINALADDSPGFVWRLQTEEGNATALHPYGDERLLLNMSVWESVDELAEFVYRSAHVDVMRRRREWFAHMRMYMALWWIPAGYIPTVADAEERLDHLATFGPTPFAFTFKVRFPPPGEDSELVEIDDELGCPA
jgi:hypothetical protein